MMDTHNSYVLIENHLKSCNLKFVLIKKKFACMSFNYDVNLSYVAA